MFYQQEFYADQMQFVPQVQTVQNNQSIHNKQFKKYSDEKPIFTNPLEDLNKQDFTNADEYKIKDDKPKPIVRDANTMAQKVIEQKVI